MQIIHTSYIKNLADDTGKTYRELEALWKKYENEVEFDRMMNPTKFSHMKRTDGGIAEEVKRRFESQVIAKPEELEIGEEEQQLQDDLNEEFADNIEDNLEGEDMFAELPEDEEFANLFSEDSEELETPMEETEMKTEETEAIEEKEED